MTKKSVLLALLVVLLLVVAVGVKLRSGDHDPGVHQTDRDTVMDQAPKEPPSPPQPPAGRSGDGPDTKSDLRASIRTLDQQGGEYAPAYLSVAEYDAIVRSPVERSGR